LGNYFEQVITVITYSRSEKFLSLINQIILSFLKGSAPTVTLKEKVLFHQIHPAKLATDIAAAVISLYFLWEHDLVIGLLTHFTPPPIASAAVIRFADLNTYKTSRLGAYLARYMGTRLAGDLISVVAAWYQSPVGILTGLGIVFAAWTYGLLSFSQN
jgi:hypothetical protein